MKLARTRERGPRQFMVLNVMVSADWNEIKCSWTPIAERG